MTDAALAYEKYPHANLYAPLAVMRRDLPRNAKGKESDVVAVLGAVVDHDADKGDVASAPVEPNYVVQSSVVPAANRQEFILFDKPLTRAEAKPLLEELHRKSGGDSGTMDMSHVWRIPGTANWPNQKKVLERKRPRDPQPVRVLKPWDGSVTAIDTLRAALAECTDKPRAGKQSNSSKENRPRGVGLIGLIMKLIKEGALEGEDRSAAFHAVVWHLAAMGLSAEQIAEKLAKYPDGIAAKFIDRLDEEITRSFQKWRKEQDQKGVTLEDFRAYMPTHQYIYVPSRELWPAGSVNSRIPPIRLFDESDNPLLNKKASR